MTTAIKFQPTDESGSNHPLDSGRYSNPNNMSNNDIENQKHLHIINLRKEIPQNIQRGIIDRNIRSVNHLSNSNAKLIAENKEKDALLPIGSSEAVKNVRPTHSMNKMLKSFNQKPSNTCKNESLKEANKSFKEKSERRQSSAYKIFGSITSTSK